MSENNASQDPAIEIALLKQSAAYQAAKYEEMAKDMKEIKATLQGVVNTLTEAKGGWRVLMMVGGASGVLGGAIVWILHNVSFKIGQ